MRPLARRLAIALAVLLLALLAAELGLRAAGYGRSPVLYYDPAVGYRFLPSQRAVIPGPDGAELARVTIGAGGYRGPAFEEPRRPGGWRVACLGDSLTFGWPVEDDQSYPAVLQELLRARPGGAAVEVGNFGVPGYNAEDELCTWRRVVQPSDPEVVVVGFYLNDVAPRQVAMRHTDNRLYALLARTALVDALRRAGRMPRDWLFVRRPPDERERMQLYKREYYRIEHFPDEPLGRPYWERAMGELRRLVRAVRGDGARLLLVCFPTVQQVDALRAGAAGPQPGPSGQGGLGAPQERVAALARSEGVPFLDLAGPMAAAAAEPFGQLDRTHPSPAGYRAAAEAIAAALAREGLTPASR